MGGLELERDTTSLKSTVVEKNQYRNAPCSKRDVYSTETASINPLLFRLHHSRNMYIVSAGLGLIFFVSFRADCVALESRPDACAFSRTDGDMEKCRKDELSTAEKALQVRLKRLQANYKNSEPRRVAELNAAQAAWAAFSKAECKFNTFESETTPAHDTELSSCLARMTNIRNDQIKAIEDHP